MSLNQFEPGWRCPHCRLVRGEDRHDPCIGRLPGVEFACCGHGGEGAYPGYISFINGVVVRFHNLHTVERWEGFKLTEICYCDEVDMTDFVSIGAEQEDEAKMITRAIPRSEPKNMNELRKIEDEVRRLTDDRDVAAQQATRKLALALQRLVEVLVHGEPKTTAAPRHHE